MLGAPIAHFSDGSADEGLEEGVPDPHPDERCRRVPEDAGQQGRKDLSIPVNRQTRDEVMGGVGEGRGTRQQSQQNSQAQRFSEWVGVVGPAGSVQWDIHVVLVRP